MDKKKKKAIIIVVAILFLGCLGGILYSVLHQPEPEPEPPVEPEPEEVVIEEVEEVRIMPIDFEYWRGINEDIYAWVSIEGTRIGYPILQHPTDNAYYLDHTIDHVKTLPGSIYTENRNAKDFTDFNTLIYGHNMKDGSMFKGLHQFRDQEFFDTHDTVMIYTEDQILTYQVYAAIVYDNRHILATYDNESVEDRQAFIQSLYDISSSTKLFREGMTIDENSKLITMSTCTGNSSTRLLVIAQQIKAE